MRKHDEEIVLFALNLAINHAKTSGEEAMANYLFQKFELLRKDLVDYGYEINQNSVIYKDELITVNSTKMHFRKNVEIDQYLNMHSQQRYF